MIEDKWPTAYSVTTDATWVSGAYLVSLWDDNNPGTITYIPSVLRDDNRTSDILYVVPITIYQAYNGWGGKSLYDYNSILPRASKVSFDRPYDHNSGSGLYFSGDYFMVQWLEH